MEENVAVRLKLFMDKIGMSNSEFADQCGIPRPTLSQLLSGRNKKVSDILVGQIHRRFPVLSIVWLLFGEGDMFLNSSRDDVPDAENDHLLSDTSTFSDNLFDFSSQDWKLSPVGQNRRENTEDNGLTYARDSASTRMNTREVEDLEKSALRHEIEKMKENPRKVVQITVYYDDSTFETFYPNNVSK